MDRWFFPFGVFFVSVGIISMHGFLIIWLVIYQYIYIYMHKDKIKEDVAHRIGARWMIQKSVLRVLCDCRIPIKVEGKFYWTSTSSIMMYGAEQ